MYSKNVNSWLNISLFCVPQMTQNQSFLEEMFQWRSLYLSSERKVIKCLTYFLTVLTVIQFIKIPKKKYRNCHLKKLFIIIAEIISELGITNFAGKLLNFVYSISIIHYHVILILIGIWPTKKSTQMSLSNLDLRLQI